MARVISVNSDTPCASDGHAESPRRHIMYGFKSGGNAPAGGGNAPAKKAAPAKAAPAKKAPAKKAPAKRHAA